MRSAKELGWDLEPSRSGFLPSSVPAWPAFRETNAQLERFAKKFEIGILSNIDDKLLGATRRHFRVDFDLVVTAQQVRSYKPDPAHFKECQRRIGGKSRLGPHRHRLRDRRRAVPEAEDPGDLGQPQGPAARVGPEEADRGGQDAARRREAARRRLAASCVRLPSARAPWSSRAGSGRRPRPRSAPASEAMLVDSPYFPDELELLPTLLSQAGFEPVGLLATHADFDHLLGRLAFPSLPLGLASRQRRAAARGARRRPARAARQRRLALRGASGAARRSARTRRCPVPGKLELGEASSSCTLARAHRGRHGAAVAGMRSPHRRRLPLERRDPGGRRRSRRLPLDPEQARRSGGARRGRRPRARLAPTIATRRCGCSSEDGAYLDALERGEERPALPAGRDTRRQREVHRENLLRI